MLNVLVKVQGLEVSSRTSSFAFKGKDTSIPEIADRLGVDHVLEGSVRKAGNTVRITAQLIDVQSDKHLWSATYDRELEVAGFTLLSSLGQLNAAVLDLPVELYDPEENYKNVRYKFYGWGTKDYN